VVSKVTGQTFETYVRENVFAPLGMEHSTLLLDEVNPALLASPHILDDTGAAMVADAIPTAGSSPRPTNLYSSAEDMAKLMEASLNQGELDVSASCLRKPSRACGRAGGDQYGRLHHGQALPVDMFPKTGMGWTVTELEGHPVVHSYGGERGYQSDMMLIPELGVGVIAMGDSDAGGAPYTRRLPSTCWVW